MGAGFCSGWAAKYSNSVPVLLALLPYQTLNWGIRKFKLPVIGDPFSKHFKQMVCCLKSTLLFRECRVELGYFRRMFHCGSCVDLRFATLMHSFFSSVSSDSSREFACCMEVLFLMLPACCLDTALGKSPVTPSTQLLTASGREQ